MKIKKPPTLVLVFFLCLFLAGVYYWIFSVVEKSKEEIVSLKTDLAIAEAKQARVKLLEAFIKEIAEDKNSIEDAFVDDRTIIKFIEEMERIAEISKVSLEIESASLPVSGQDLGPRFKLTVEGGFGHLFRYLKLLEDSPFQVLFKEVAFIKPDSAGRGSWTLNAELIVLSYIF